MPNTAEALAETVDLARELRAGYHDAAETRAGYEAVLRAVQKYPKIGSERSATHNVTEFNKICGRHSDMVVRLGALVRQHLPELLPELRQVTQPTAWHLTPRFNWIAAERELDRIEATANVALRRLARAAPAKNRGGRPRKRDDLVQMWFKRSKGESQKEVISRYNQRYSNTIAAGKRKKATVRDLKNALQYRKQPSGNQKDKRTR